MPVSNNPITNVLYRIMSQRKGQDRTPQEIMQAVKDEISSSAVKLNYTGGGDQENYEYDNWNNPARDFNKLYLTGETGEIQELPANTPGFSYSNYIKKTGYTPKTYQGQILQTNLLFILVTGQLLKVLLVNTHTLINLKQIMMMLLIIYKKLEEMTKVIWKCKPLISGIFNLMIGKIYGRRLGKTKHKLISQLGAQILDAAGKPFILRDNAKIRFTDNANEVNSNYLIENLGLPQYTGVDKSGTPNFNLPEITVTPTGNKYKTADWHVESKSVGGSLNYFDYFK